MSAQTQPEVSIVTKQFPNSRVISSGTVKEIAEFNPQSIWIAPGRLSVHLPSGKKSIAHLEKSMFKLLKAHAEKSKEFLITLQGDFNINFLDTKLDEKGKHSGEGLLAFLEVLEKAGITIRSVDMTPGYATDKSRGWLVDNAQQNKANSKSVAIKDIVITLDFTPKEKLDADGTKAREEAHQASVAKLKGLGKIVKIQKVYPEQIATDHPMVCSKSNGKWFVSHNLISSKINKNTLYDMKNRDAIVKASNDYSNFQWRFFANPENGFLSESEKKELFGDLDIKTIDFNRLDVEYRINGATITGEALRKKLEAKVGAAWKKQFSYEMDETDVQKPIVKASDGDVSRCRAMVSKFYKACYASDEWKAYNGLFIKPYGQKELDEIMACNVGNPDTIKAYIKSGPSKILTYIAMGGVQDPITTGADIAHTDFIHPCCFQAFGGFRAPPQKTQKEVDIAQAKEFFEQAIANKIDGPIELAELIECQADNHNPILYALIERIVELSHQRKLSEMSVNDFDREVFHKAKGKPLPPPAPPPTGRETRAMLAQQGVEAARTRSGSKTPLPPPLGKPKA